MRVSPDNVREKFKRAEESFGRSFVHALNKNIRIGETLLTHARAKRVREINGIRFHGKTTAEFRKSLLKGWSALPDQMQSFLTDNGFRFEGAGVSTNSPEGWSMRGSAHDVGAYYPEENYAVLSEFVLHTKFPFTPYLQAPTVMGIIKEKWQLSNWAI